MKITSDVCEHLRQRIYSKHQQKLTIRVMTWKVEASLQFDLFPPGGSCAEAGSPTCTHLVIAEHSVKTIPFETLPRLLVVKSEVTCWHQLVHVSSCNVSPTIWLTLIKDMTEIKDHVDSLKISSNY